MATLVLQTAGNALGGPLGAFIGATIGNRIDHRLMGGAGRKGPRLGDLSVQRAHYGSTIPCIYGTMRVAGTLVWATDLVESETVTGAKGQADTTSYSYSASFAVALSARAVVRIGRIWADGKLLRGREGDLKVGGTLRIHAGGEDQAVDPLIESLEGDAPAYRGLALAVFEELELAEYGNRIPMLTFEVIADESAVAVGELLVEAGGGTIEAHSSAKVEGYAVHGASLGEGLAPLVAVHDLQFTQARGLVVETEAVAVALGEDDLGCEGGWQDKGPAARMTRTRRALTELPRGVSLDHYDPARDFQAGRASAHGDPDARGELRIDAPMTMSADAARGHAERALHRLYRERERIDLALSPRWLGLRPGTIVKLEAMAWRIVDVELDEGVVKCGGVLAGAGAQGEPIASDGGRANLAPDILLAPTDVALFDLPDLGTGATAAMTVAAASASSGWRAVPLAWTAGDASGSLASAGRESVMGRCEQVPDARASVVPDRESAIVVALCDPDQALVATDDDGLAAGDNLAAVGDELIQFRDVEPLGGNRFRVSHLLRGVRGTEWAMAGHAADEAFVLIDPARLATLPIARERVGATVSVTPAGIADTASEASVRLFTGEALRPPSPAHLVASVASDGAVQIAWVARSRLGWGWTDGSEPGPGESHLRYRVTLSNGTASLELESEATNVLVEAAAMAPFAGSEVAVSVATLGDIASSRPASIVIPFQEGPLS